MVWIATGVSCSRDELFQPLPESRFDRSVMLTPLICAVENFSVHVVLNLIRCGISPPDRQGSSVAGIAEVLTLLWRKVSINVVEHARPFAAVNCIEHPFQETSRLARKPDPVERVNGERRIANPGITVIPVPAPAHAFRYRRGRPRNNGPGAHVIPQLQ